MPHKEDLDHTSGISNIKSTTIPIEHPNPHESCGYPFLLLCCCSDGGLCADSHPLCTKRGTQEHEVGTRGSTILLYGTNHAGALDGMVLPPYGNSPSQTDSLSAHMPPFPLIYKMQSHSHSPTEAQLPAVSPYHLLYWNQRRQLDY